MMDDFKKLRKLGQNTKYIQSILKRAYVFFNFVYVKKCM